jgi:FixJ family two-component response regulator
MSTKSAMVFVVDDDASVRRSLVRFFRSAGFEAEAFESAHAYLDRDAYDGPSCLVLDVRMPELSGLDLQRALIASQREEQIIFLTGKGDVPTCARAMKEGAVDFLQKPFHDDELLAAVHRALARSSEGGLQRIEQAEARARVVSLTPREFQVFERVIAGKLNKEIAAELGTALKTVKIQRAAVMAKMHVVSVADLVRLAEKAGTTPARRT